MGDSVSMPREGLQSRRVARGEAGTLHLFPRLPVWLQLAAADW